MAFTAGIDAGTQSLKVVVYDPAARTLVASASAPLDLISGDDGSREQHRRKKQDGGDADRQIQQPLEDAVAEQQRATGDYEPWTPN